MACVQKKYTGKTVIVEYQIGCGDTMPVEADWKRIGAMRSKEFSVEWETTDATADDSVGALRENLATFMGLTMSGDGTAVTGEDGANVRALERHVINPVETGGQPTVWMRMTFPDTTYTAFMLVTTASRSAPYDDVVTYSLEASATASNFGLIVEDTPDPDAPTVTGVTVVPATLSLAIGETYDVEAVVLPTSASQSVTWASSDVAVATVNAATGVVTAVDAGTATITATSTISSTQSGSCSVTVA